MNTRDARVVDREDGSAEATPSATTFGLRSTSKIRDRHLDRLAIVYVRQSSPQQVLENRESRERQYALAQFAQRLGWPAERVVIIDEDQGQSGKSADNRSGFQRLMTEVSLNHVGIVLGLELSRLSRSNKEWHQLIDVCGIFNTLLCDQDGVYDPLDSNDRLLLGMKGAMSEFELVTLRNRLLRGSRNKAERGELFLAVPLGYLKTPSGEIIQEPDEQARGMIRLVFEKFEELGSAYAVFRYLVVNDLQLGFRRHRGGRIGELEWRPPSPARILSILRHPIYAGAYAYGLHRAGTKNPATGRIEGGKWFVPPEELPVLLRDRLPAYISWDQYMANQERLKQNRSLQDTRGVPKRGEALLPGLVVCGKCGHHMTTRYKTDKRPSYYCGEYCASGPGRALRAHLGGDAGRLGREGSAPGLGARRARSQPARHRERRARAQAPPRPVASDPRTRATGRRASRAAVSRRGAREPTRGAHAGGALGGRAEEATSSGGGIPSLPGETAGDAERRRPTSGSGRSPRASPRSGTLRGRRRMDRKQIVRCVVERVIVVADKSTESQRGDDRLARRRHDTTSGRSARRQL